MSNITRKRKVRLMILWMFLILKKSTLSHKKSHRRKRCGCGRSLKIIKNTKEFKKVEKGWFKLINSFTALIKLRMKQANKFKSIAAVSTAKNRLRELLD